MTIIQAVVLGLVQGLTEFLPISSSGHLVLIQNFFGLNQPQLIFDIFVHFGTMCAVLLFFSKDIRAILSNISTIKDIHTNPHTRMLWLIIIASLPTFVIAFIFSVKFIHAFNSVYLVSVMLLITGVLLWYSETIISENKKIFQMNFKHALIIGAVQGLAVTPGISRSGSTIATGLFCGIDRELAARFSFLLSVPAISAAFLMAVSQLLRTGFNLSISIACLIIGTLVSFVSGYYALKILFIFIRKKKLWVFAAYCWIVGSLLLLGNIMGVN